MPKILISSKARNKVLAKGEVLIIEDELLLSQMYRDNFEKAGFTVSSSIDVESAFETIKKKPPDLVILDILLPGENGLSLFEKLKGLKRKMPIVVLSNYDDAKTVEKALLLGAKEYLIKTDFTPAKLLKRIMKYVKQR